MEERMIRYRIFRVVLGGLYKFWYNPKVYGKENIPNDGPVIIAGNHIHIMDQCNVIISTKRCIHYMAKKEYFDNKKVAWFFKSAHCIPVDRSKHDDAAKVAGLEVLNKKEALGIFPEGTINRTDDIIMPFKIGAVKACHDTNTKLVPFIITGKYRLFRKGIKVEFLKPIKIGDDLTKENEKFMKIVSKKLEESKHE